MIRPTVARIDLNALKSNYRVIVEHLSAERAQAPRVIAVVKANAYGHGAVECARVLEDAGADCFAVALIEEGIERESILRAGRFDSQRRWSILADEWRQRGRGDSR